VNAATMPTVLARSPFSGSCCLISRMRLARFQLYKNDKSPAQTYPETTRFFYDEEEIDGSVRRRLFWPANLISGVVVIFGGSDVF